MALLYTVILSQEYIQMALLYTVILSQEYIQMALLYTVILSQEYIQMAVLYTVTLSQECIQTGVVHYCSCVHLFNHEMMLLAASMTDAAFSSDCKYTLLSG